MRLDWSDVRQQRLIPPIAIDLPDRGALDDVLATMTLAEWVDHAVAQIAAQGWKKAPEPPISAEAAVDRSIARHARAVQEIFEIQHRGGTSTPEQDRELEAARRDLNAQIPYGSDDAEKACSRDGTLALAASTGDSRRISEQMAVEANIRTDPQKRADRFVDR